MEPRLISPELPEKPRRSSNQPPTNAPAIPIRMVTRMPPGSGPGIASLARAPATSPTTIQTTIAPTLMSVHLPPRWPLNPCPAASRQIYSRALRPATSQVLPRASSGQTRVVTPMLSGEGALQCGPYEGQREEHSGTVEQGMDLSGFATGELDQGVGDETEADAVRNIEGQRERQEGGIASSMSSRGIKRTAELAHKLQAATECRVLFRAEPLHL